MIRGFEKCCVSDETDGNADEEEVGNEGVTVTVRHKMGIARRLKLRQTTTLANKGRQVKLNCHVYG
jgi:hypothetical protein